MTTNMDTPPTVGTLAAFLDRFAPADLAEEWDNVGLLVGDAQAGVARLMTCLTITPATVAEAIAGRAEMIVAHHPLPFRPLKRLTRDTTPGSMLLDLIAAGIAVYSPHTAFDSAAQGINQHLAEGLGLTDIRPLVPSIPKPCATACLPDSAEKTCAAACLPDSAENTGATACLPDSVGSGRWGRISPPLSLAQFATRVKTFLSLTHLQLVGDDDQQTIAAAAVACGAAGEFLTAAAALGCNCLVVGETNFHTCLEAQARGIALILPGHFASERFAVERLAEILAAEFSAPARGGLTIWASREERDPIRWT